MLEAGGGKGNAFGVKTRGNVAETEVSGAGYL
jgi:hypothetical protein